MVSLNVVSNTRVSMKFPRMLKDSHRQNHPGQRRYYLKGKIYRTFLVWLHLLANTSAIERKSPATTSAAFQFDLSLDSTNTHSCLFSSYAVCVECVCHTTENLLADFVVLSIRFAAEKKIIGYFYFSI